MKNKLLKLLFASSLLLASCVKNNGMCACETKIDENGDSICDVCGKQIEGLCIHVDKNNDYICDYCGEEIPHELIPVSLGEANTPETIIIGEVLSLEDINVVVNYDDGSNEEKNPTKIELDTTTSGEKTGTLYYGELSKEFTINVVGRLVGLGEVSSPDSIEQNKTLKVSELSVLAIYSDETTKAVIPDSVELDTSVAGLITGTVTYQGYNTTFKINVVSTEGEKTLVSLGAVTVPQTIEQNSTLSLTSVTVVANYSNQTFSIVNPEEIILNTSTLGDANGTAKYGGMEASFTIRVVEASPSKEISSLGAVTVPETIAQNATLSAVDVSVVVNYCDSTSGSVTPESVTLDTSVCGTTTGTISYKGFNATFEIEVLNVVVSLGQVSASETIVLNATLSPESVNVVVNYSNGTTQTVHPESIDLDTTSIGPKVGYANYQGFKAVFAILVVTSDTPVTITGIGGASGPKEVAQNYVISASEVTLYAYFSDGTSKKVTPDEILADTSKAGNITVTVKYGAYQTTFDVTVKEVASVTTYLVLTSVGLYNGKVGDNFDSLFIENAIAFTEVPGANLPGADVVTHKFGNCDFAGWVAYENEGAPKTYTTVPFEQNKILYATWVDNGKTPHEEGGGGGGGEITPDPTPETKTYYLLTNFTDGSGNWDQQCQIMWAYVWKGDYSCAYQMSWYEGTKWKVDIPINTYDWVIFCRVDPTYTTFDYQNWSGVYNQTTNLKFDSSKDTAQIDNWDHGDQGHSQVHWVS